MSNSALDGEIRDGFHVMPVRVYYEDTDFSGAVYHASYLRFMERGRTNYLRLLGADQRALFEEVQREAPGFAFVVRAMQIEFRKPARMDDVLVVVTQPQEVKGASITLHQRDARARPPGRGTCAGRIRVGRPGAAHPRGAAQRHGGGPGGDRARRVRPARSRHGCCLAVSSVLALSQAAWKRSAMIWNDRSTAVLRATRKRSAPAFPKSSANQAPMMIVTCITTMRM
jgi:acyl-CoA thioester hydrolase